jgi:antitoxin PrlF
VISSRLTSKAQTTIPQPVRTALKVRPGDSLTYEIDGDRVILTKAAGEAASEDPFATFTEWDGEADRKAYADL